MVGARISCENIGKGIIEKVVNQGQSIALIVNFGKHEGTKLMPLNLKTMAIIEEYDEPDES
jgi:hypothetical protein